MAKPRKPSSGHRARKRFGQNFLTDANIIGKIAQAIAAKPSDCIVEIGPGQGALTRPLLNALNELHVIELDRNLIGPLKALDHPQHRLHIHNLDVLKFDFKAHAAQQNQALRIVGNLPYNISTPLMFHLLESGAPIHDMHFMLQKEVVDRLIAHPGNKNYGRLSVMTAYHARADALFTVSPGAFQPRPKVNSAVVRLRPHPKPPVDIHHLGLFRLIVRDAFNQRRKTLARIFKGRLSADQLQALDIDPSARPETLELQTFARLANQLAADELPSDP